MPRVRRTLRRTTVTLAPHVPNDNDGPDLLRFSVSPGAIVFWMLILLALGALIPCVLLPEWRQYQALCQAEQAQRHRADSLQRRIEKQRRLLMALRSDPAVVARLARREYGFQREGEQVVAVTLPAVARARVGSTFVSVGPPVAGVASPVVGDEPFLPQPVSLPPVLARAASYLPADYDYDRIFGDDQTRLVIMVMSVALIAVAFALFSRQGCTDPQPARSY